MTPSMIKKLASEGDIEGLRAAYEGAKSWRKRRAVVESLSHDSSRGASSLLAHIAMSDSDERVRGCAALWVISPSRDALDLVDLSSERSAKVLIAVARRLDRTQPDSSIRLLGSLVTFPDRDVRQAAVRSLGRISGPGVTKALAPALEDPDRMVRVFAADALAGSGDPVALGLIEDRLESEDGAVRTAMSRALEDARNSNTS